LTKLQTNGLYYVILSPFQQAERIPDRKAAEQQEMFG
jgi:hypothetical protein